MKTFYKIVYKNKVTLRVDNESLDQFLEAHGHQGQTGSRSWGTAQSGSPGRYVILMLYWKFFKNKATLRVDSQNLDQFWKVYGHQGQTESRSWGTAPSGSPGSCFTKKLMKHKVII